MGKLTATWIHLWQSEWVFDIEKTVDLSVPALPAFHTFVLIVAKAFLIFSNPGQWEH